MPLPRFTRCLVPLLSSIWDCLALPSRGDPDELAALFMILAAVKGDVVSVLGGVITVRACCRVSNSRVE